MLLLHFIRSLRLTIATWQVDNNANSVFAFRAKEILISLSEVGEAYRDSDFVNERLKFHLHLFLFNTNEGVNFVGLQSSDWLINNYEFTSAFIYSTTFLYKAIQREKFRLSS